VGIALWTTTRTVSAGGRTGELRFEPAEPHRGDAVDVTYLPSGLLGQHDRLVLRARYRSAADDWYNRGAMQRTAGTLTRGRDGAFRTTVRLPDSVVYAVFAVEDPAGRVVDHNDRRLWELLIHDAEQQPTYEALDQRVADMMGRNWEVAFETVRHMTSLYPARPAAWSLLLMFERWVLGREAADSARRSHQERSSEFDQRYLKQATLSAAQVFEMGSYAMYVEDRDRARYWRDRLRQDFPYHPRVIFQRANDLRTEYPEQPAAYLAAVEPLWSDLQAARIRYRAGSMLRRAPLRTQAMDWIRQELDRLDRSPAAYRPLTRTVGAQRAVDHKASQLLLADLGKALLETGDTAAALDTLELAGGRGWNPEAFRMVVDLWLAVGDTVKALENVAKVAIDPGTDSTFADSVRMTLGVDAGRWQSLAAGARVQMRETVLADAGSRRLRTPIRLRTGGGRVERLEDLSAGRITLVAFWSRFCGPAVQQLPRLQQLAEQLDALGVQVVTVIDEPLAADVEQFLREKGLSLPVYYDVRRDAARAFIQFAQPEYYLVDASGQIRFERSGLEDIVRQATVLVPSTTGSDP
jgi:thiol-disulfide isomerase/thioredoxin